MLSVSSFLSGMLVTSYSWMHRHWPGLVAQFETQAAATIRQIHAAVQMRWTELWEPKDLGPSGDDPDALYLNKDLLQVRSTARALQHHLHLLNFCAEKAILLAIATGRCHKLARLAAATIP
jgi:hypothetical protein